MSVGSEDSEISIPKFLWTLEIGADNPITESTFKYAVIERLDFMAECLSLLVGREVNGSTKITQPQLHTEQTGESDSDKEV